MQPLAAERTANEVPRAVLKEGCASIALLPSMDENFLWTSSHPQQIPWCLGSSAVILKSHQSAWTPCQYQIGMPLAVRGVESCIARLSLHSLLLICYQISWQKPGRMRSGASSLHSPRSHWNRLLQGSLPSDGKPYIAVSHPMNLLHHSAAFFTAELSLLWTLESVGSTLGL